MNKKLFLLLITVLLIYSSCATRPPAEKTIFLSLIEDLEVYWQTLEDGLDFFHGKLSSPRMEFWALRIDLDSPYLQIVVRAGAVGSDSHSNTFSTRVSSFVRDNDLIAGINATPFNISSSREGQLIRNIGIIISDGKLIAPVVHRHYALVFYKDGTASIVRQREIYTIENIKNAAGAFHQILLEGELTPRTLRVGTVSAQRHARSAAGIAANGRQLYMIVIDGRRIGSGGATEMETALLLRFLGSWNAVNLDGGGSSAMALRCQNGQVRVVNTPGHGLIPGTERAVAGSLGVLVLPGKNEIF